MSYKKDPFFVQNQGLEENPFPEVAAVARQRSSLPASAHEAATAALLPSRMRVTMSKRRPSASSHFSDTPLPLNSRHTPLRDLAARPRPLPPVTPAGAAPPPFNTTPHSSYGSFQRHAPQLPHPSRLAWAASGGWRKPGRAAREERRGGGKKGVERSARATASASGARTDRPTACQPLGGRGSLRTAWRLGASRRRLLFLVIIFLGSLPAPWPPPLERRGPPTSFSLCPAD